MRRLAAAAALASLALLAVPASGAAPVTVTMATVNNMNHLPEFVGVEKGFFVKHGVDLKLKVLNSGSEVMRAFQGGDAQFIPLSPTLVAAAANNGLSVRPIAGIMGDPTRPHYDDMFAIVARPGSGIRAGHPEDLAGKRVGMVLAGTGEQYLRGILTRANLAAERVTFVNVPPPDSVSVLRSGSVDAESVWEPYGTMLLDQVPGTALVQRGGGVLDYTLWVGSSEDYLKKNPALAQHVVDGFVEAEWYIRTHRADAAQIATHWIEGLDPKSAEKAIAFMSFDPRFGTNTVKAAEAEQAGIIALGRVKKPVAFAPILQNGYVAQAERDDGKRFFNDLKPIR